MKRITRSLILFIVVAFYALLYWATSVDKCDEDCQKQIELSALLAKNRTYVYGAWRCSQSYISDTLCVSLKDTVGVNWDLLADTACQYANSLGLYHQKVFLIKIGVSRPDTVARKQCP